MKLVRQYLEKVDFAGDLQSIVFAFFFVLFLVIVYFVLKGNKKQYKDYGDMPLDSKDKEKDNEV